MLPVHVNRSTEPVGTLRWFWIEKIDGKKKRFKSYCSHDSWLYLRWHLIALYSHVYTNYIPSDHTFLSIHFVQAWKVDRHLFFKTSLCRFARPKLNWMCQSCVCVCVEGEKVSFWITSCAPTHIRRCICYESRPNWILIDWRCRDQSPNRWRPPQNQKWCLPFVNHRWKLNGNENEWSSSSRPLL